jgi:hypothetical protein
MGYYPVNTGINAILVTIFLLIEVSDLRSYSVVVEMITVGTPGLGVRHPHGSNPATIHPGGFPSGRFSIQAVFHPGGFPSRRFPSGRKSMRLADAQTGRPYSG